MEEFGKLKTVCLQDQCTGCMACTESCAKHAIRIVDSLQSYNAVIDEAMCVDCNRCHTVCQVNNPLELQEPIFWCEGWANAQQIRSISSSGGYALAIETAFIRNGGWVCSCSFDDGRFAFSLVNQEEETGRFAGSKYVKSDPGGIYTAIQEKLVAGDKVLFVGLPCQAAALIKYIRYNIDNLYIIDLICHGTPSPKMLERFLKDYRFSLSNIGKLSFREKNNFFLKNSEASLCVPVVKDHYILR